jgi:hypothetical protein
MKMVIVAYLLQAVIAVIAISEKAKAPGLSFTGVPREAPPSLFDPSNYANWMMLGLFGALGVFRSALEFMEKGKPMNGTWGVIAGVILLAATFMGPGIIGR